MAILENISNEEYHKNLEGLSHSMLLKFRKSPAHYQSAIHGAEEPVSSATQKAFDEGTLFHCMLLEPERFESCYAVIDGDRRTKAVKDAIAEAKASGKIIIDSDQLAMLNSMKQAVLANSDIARLISNSKHEVTCTATIDGVACKVRPDGVMPDEGIMFDLKSTKDASFESFSKDIGNLGYFIEDAYYRMVWEQSEGKKIDHFLFIACEKEAPFGVALYELTPEDVESTKAEIHEDLINFKECLETGKWNGYTAEIQQVSLPSWHKRKH